MIDDVKLSTKLSKELHAKNDHGKPEVFWQLFDYIMIFIGCKED